MPMTAFLLQDIPAEVAEHATRIARSCRRGINEVLIELLVRATAQAAPCAPPIALAAAAGAAPPPQPSLAAPAPHPAPGSQAEPELLPLLEAMQAAQRIPVG